MKKLLFLVVVLALAGMTVTAAYADTKKDATASVYVKVDPNVAVSPKTPIVDAGSIQTGTFFATIVFTIGANKEEVNFTLEASDLYKGDDPTNKDVAPILLDQSVPASLVAALGNEKNAGDNKAAWLGPSANPIGLYPAFTTETVVYESSQNGHFSQDVTTKIQYKQPDPEKTTGQYSGKVRLTAFLL